MAGAIAGTAILKGLSLTKKLRTVTLTINNNCNLSCPHCYLQYSRRELVLSQATIDSVFRADFEHLAIVGKEPLLNSKSIELLEQLVSRSAETGRTVSIISNGLGLERLPVSIADQLAYIDISFDGGPATYESYRKASFTKLIRNIQTFQQGSSVQLNALHNINNLNLAHIDDMMQVDAYADFGIIMFSPYLVTQNEGRNSVNAVSLASIFRILANSSSFLNNLKSLLLLDIYHLLQEGLSYDMVGQLIADFGLTGKITLIEKDPLLFGIVRVTFDDLVLSPYDSIHPSLYSRTSKRASENDLNKLYSEMTAAHV